MRSRINAGLTYANVMATFAVFVALGGGAYAAVSLPRNSVGSAQIMRNAITSAKVKDGALLAADFASGQLPTGAQGPQGAPGLKGDAGPQGVKGDTGPSTGPAGGALSGSYPNPTLSCPAGTSRQGDSCFETTDRPAADWFTAADTCAGAGRRLGTPSEMWAISRRPDIRTVGWTSSAYTDSNGNSRTVMATVVLIAGGPGNNSFVSSYAMDQTITYRCFINAGNA